MGRTAIAASLLAFLTLSAAAPAVADKPKAPPPAVKISLDAARATALRQVAGTVVDEELEREKGRWVYEFEIRPTTPAGAALIEVTIDADSGAVLEVEADED